MQHAIPSRRASANDDLANLPAKLSLNRDATGALRSGDFLPDIDGDGVVEVSAAGAQPGDDWDKRSADERGGSYYTGSGFYRSDVLRNLKLDTIRSDGYIFQIETSFRAWRLGYRLRDFPIIFYERRAGQSKLDLSIAFEALRVVLYLGLTRILSAKPGSVRDRPAPEGK